MQVQVECTTETLNQCHRACLTCLSTEACLLDHPTRQATIDQSQHATHHRWPNEAEKVERELDLHFREYENSVLAIGAARDYSQLYNQLASRGDALQAWRFRQQAEQSLDQASSRARYRRQPDVLVNLYLSNDSMKRALSSLQKADAVYSRYGLDDVDRSRRLQDQIY